MASNELSSSVKIAAPPKELEREPLVLNNRPPSWITNQVVGIIEGKTPRWWWVTFIISALVMLLCPIYDSLLGPITHLSTTTAKSEFEVFPESRLESES